MTDPDAIDAAARRLAVALDALQAAVVRKRESESGGSAVAMQLQALGNDTMDMSPQEFSRLVRSEMDDYARVLKAAGVKPQ